MQLADKKVISGYPDGTFRPEGLVTRSEFAAMMTLALEIPLLIDPTQSFADVDINNWAFVYIETTKKYITGYQQGGNHYFRGSNHALREDMAIALAKALGLETEVPDDINAGYVYARLQAIFSDTDSISPNLREYDLTAYDAGLIGGYPDGTFGAQRSITRGEAAALLVKVLNSEAMKNASF
jgi:hypothetical protein